MSDLTRDAAGAGGAFPPDACQPPDSVHKIVVSEGLNRRLWSTGLFHRGVDRSIAPGYQSSAGDAPRRCSSREWPSDGGVSAGVAAPNVIP